MKCPKCKGPSQARPITGHESQFDQVTGVTTRTRACKSSTCATVFKTFERLDVDDGELRRRAFLHDLAEARLKQARAVVGQLQAAMNAALDPR
jgi:transcriptional regulator NrdR family protein